MVNKQIISSPVRACEWGRSGRISRVLLRQLFSIENRLIYCQTAKRAIKLRKQQSLISQGLNVGHVCKTAKQNVHLRNKQSAELQPLTNFRQQKERNYSIRSKHSEIYSSGKAFTDSVNQSVHPPMVDER